MTEATLRSIDDFWSKDVGCSREQLRAERTIVVAHPDQYADFTGIFILLIGTAPIISLPRNLYSSLSIKAQTWIASDVVDSACLRSLIGDRVDRIIGPAFIGYTESGMIRPIESSSTTVLRDEHADIVASLRTACDPIEWADGGRELGENPAVGVFVGTELAALAGYDIWSDRIAQISIVTHPRYRRRGYASAAVSRLAEITLERGLVPQYRTLDGNTGSMKIAAKLGFIRYATTMTAWLRPRS